MAFDIRPNPLRPHPSDAHPDRAPSSRSGGERRAQLVAFIAAVIVVLIGAAVWVALGAPGAPTSVKRSIGKLPVAGERRVPGGAESGGRAVAESPISGMPCGKNARRRPIAVMLAADPINRPVSGFAFADAVFELPVLVNNITRLMAVYQCQEPRELGSVRSARHDYLFLARGMDAVLVHWGGSYHALNRIRAERNVYDSVSALGTGQQAFFRKSSLPAPYNGFTTYARVWKALVDAGYRTTTTLAPSPHVDDAPPSERGGPGTLEIGWPGAMRVTYVYNPATNAYERSWGGARHLDAIDNVPVAPKVVAIAHTRQRFAEGPGGYNEVDVEGGGAAEVYQNGRVIAGAWEKSEIHKQDPLVFRDAAGNPLPLVRGQLWIHFVDAATPVTWTPGGGGAE